METSASLLSRLRAGTDEQAWQHLDLLYRPLIARWLRSDPGLGDEAEDLVQDVMAVLVRELPRFQRRRTGSFRRWLRTITVRRLAVHWRTCKDRPRPLGGSPEESPLAQLTDPNSELSRRWDAEHDKHVLRRLMDLIAPQFAPATLAAFRRAAFDGVTPAQVAEEMGLSLNAVLLAKSRVLGRLRQEAEGLID
ncbi:MAG TPA: RNA polymerase sigma factor [Gemmataceae bacterium]|nr:RNA polymerase sigma factor [Gemmataceae bacterium]